MKTKFLFHTVLITAVAFLAIGVSACDYEEEEPPQPGSYMHAYIDPTGIRLKQRGFSEGGIWWRYAFSLHSSYYARSGNRCYCLGRL